MKFVLGVIGVWFICLFGVMALIHSTPETETVQHDGYTITYLDRYRGKGQGARSVYRFDDGTTCMVVNGGSLGATDNVSCARVGQ